MKVVIFRKSDRLGDMTGWVVNHVIRFIQIVCSRDKTWR